MSPTGTGEGSQVFYMMLGLNTVLVKTMPSEVDCITGTEFRLNNQSTLNLMTPNQTSLTLGLSDQFADT
jgi:hypothetical protein